MNPTPQSDTPTPESPTKCRMCGREYDLREDSEPTPYCDLCAHKAVEKLERELNAANENLKVVSEESERRRLAALNSFHFKQELLRLQMVIQETEQSMAHNADERDQLRTQLADAKRDADNCRQIIDTYSRQEDDLAKAIKTIDELNATHRIIAKAFEETVIERDSLRAQLAECEKDKERLENSPTWPHVLAFAKRMEAKLEKNRHKGNREGWLKDHPWALVERILDETVELQRCFHLSHGGTISWPDSNATADECADVANFCMMVADSVTAIDSAIAATKGEK